jgi:hypothetical protein
MSPHLHLVDSRHLAPGAWPSIASASAQLRRPRRLEVVPARAETSAVLDRAARPRPPRTGRR